MERGFPNARAIASTVLRDKTSEMTVIGITSQDDSVRAVLLHDHDLMALLV
jgi:hypothetical protein